MNKFTTSVFALVSFFVVAFGFASTAKADPDPCQSLKTAYAACVADKDKDCKAEADKVNACVASQEICKADVEAMAAADPKCKAVYDDRHKDDDKKAAPKVVPLVCDAPATKKSKGFGCECPSGMFLSHVAGKPGHQSCASTVDPEQVSRLKRDVELMGKKKLTAAERGELKAYEEVLKSRYLLDPKTGDSTLPDYAAAYIQFVNLYLDFYGQDGVSGWKARTDQRISDLEQCLANGVGCEKFSDYNRIRGWQAKLQACFAGTGSCEEFPEFDKVRAEARNKVYVRLNLGPTIGWRKGGDTVYTLETGVGLFAPITPSVDWFLKGSIGYGHTGGLGSVGVGRVGTGVSFKLTDSFSLEPEGFVRFLGRFDSLVAKDGSTLVKGGYGGHLGGFALGFHKRITDVIGIGGFVAGEYQKNEWATCTLSKACYRSDSGIGASVGLNLTVSLGAPRLR